MRAFIYLSSASNVQNWVPPRLRINLSGFIVTAVHMRNAVSVQFLSEQFFLAFITKLIDCKLVNSKWPSNSFFLFFVSGNMISIQFVLSNFFLLS